jgi:hypothetical protein
VGDAGSALFALLVTAIILVPGLRPITDAMLTRWSLRFDVVVDSANREWLVSRLRRARAVRWIAFAAGVNISLLPAHLSAIDPGIASLISPWTSSAPIAAAALGALLAELLVVQRADSARIADVAPRRWRDYIGIGWIVAVLMTIPLALIAAVTATAGHHGGRWSSPWTGPVLAIGAAVLAAVGLRRIVDRPPLAASGQVRLLDDAFRADGVHHLVGASLALAGTAAVDTVLLTMSPGGWSLLVGLARILVLGAWIGLARDEPWNVARVPWRQA